MIHLLIPREEIDGHVVYHSEIGETLWKRFNRGKDAQKWYYQGLVQALRDDSADEAYQILHRQFVQEVRRIFGKDN